jgi:hypothetical protein
MGIGDVSDEDIVQAGDELHSLITLIPVDDWRRVLAAEARVRVLEAAEQAGATGVSAVIGSLSSGPQRPPGDSASPPSRSKRSE